MDVVLQRKAVGYAGNNARFFSTRSPANKIADCHGGASTPPSTPRRSESRLSSTMERSNRATTCFACESRGRSEWCSLEGSELELLNKAKVTNVYQPGQIIFYQGNPCLGIYCVESGTVAVRKNDANGNSVIVRMASAGDTLGYRAFFASEPYRASADALEPSRICFIDKNAVRSLLANNPSVGHGFLRHMAHDLDDAEEAKLHASALSVRARLAHLLLVLKDRFGTVDDDGVLSIKLPMSRQDIAAMVGTRPETIARAVRALEDDGVAKFDGRRAIVADLDALLDEIERE